MSCRQCNDGTCTVLPFVKTNENVQEDDQQENIMAFKDEFLMSSAITGPTWL
ncbi:MAG: hypothetical protein IPI30_23725 [Saprospiraceae bacterium]|nr:hypothetical protein [Candidatus Vicinibacter affinis]